MPDYKSMYYSLFNTVTSTIEALKDAQRKCEEIYVNSEEINKEELIFPSSKDAD